MREKWTRKDIQQGTSNDSGQPVGQRISLFPEAYRPKLASSVRAIDQYNSIVTDDFVYSYDNISYIPENETIDSKSIYSTYTNNYYHSTSLDVGNSHAFDRISPKGTIYVPNTDNFYDYATVRSNSVAGTSTIASEADNDRKDILGSATNLINGKKSVTCWSWFSYVETVLCTISLAAGLGNVYRLTQVTLIGGGLPFLLAYVILALFIGFPLLFLELGLGQLVQEGFTKTWRAVPLLKGVTYVKFFALCLLSFYYPLYVGLFAFYLVWFASQGTPPFSECDEVIQDGNETRFPSGQECIKQTFLESPYVDPQWFGIFVALLMLIWIIVSVLLCRRTRAFVFSLILLVILAVGCFIALTVKAVEEDGKYSSLDKLLTNIDWSLLTTTNVWYFAAIQVFYSTNLGMGPFVTNAGIIYNKANVFWIALSLTFLSLIFGISSVVLTYIISGTDLTLQSGDIPEVHLITIIYESALQHSSSVSQLWTLIVLSLLVCSGFISMITIVYTILKAIRVESRKKWSWWQSLVLLSFTGVILGSMTLLVPNFKVVRLLDHYVVGNLVLLCTILEISAIVSYYGSKRLRLDFEFILGTKLPILNIILWWFVPIALLFIFLWALATVKLNGTIDDDPLWLYTTGWSIVVASLVFIALVSFYQISKQDEYYTFNDKIKASTKPLRKWGPIDPIMRYNWVQWHSKAKKGVRDFTLKRRGTRDYTHSVKKRKATEPRNFTPLSEVSTTRGSTPTFHNNDLNQNNIRISTTSSQYIEPLNAHDYENPEIKMAKQGNPESYEDQLRVTYCFDALDPPGRNAIPPPGHNTHYPPGHDTLLNNFEPKSNGIEVKKSFNNPLSNPDLLNMYNENVNGSSPSEGYGTYKNGPYIIEDNLEHIYYQRKNSEYEESTEL